MRNLVPLFLVLFGFGAAVPALAQQSAGDVESIPVNTGEDDAPRDQPSAIYSTIGVGLVSADFENVKDAINIEFTLVGFRVPTFPWVGVELNFGTTMIPGQVESPNCGLTTPCPDNVATSSDSFAVNTGGLFGVVRTPGSFFGVGKVGYRFVSSSLREVDDQGNGSSWSIGGGYRWNTNGFIELTYSDIAESVDSFGLTISYSYDN